MINWSELGVFISVCFSAVVGLVFALQKSKCEDITCCYGAVKCHRPKELIQNAGAEAGADANVDTHP